MTRKHGGLAVIAGLLTLGLSAVAVPAAVAGPKAPAAYSFRKIDNGGDRSFNQLLGINNIGRIAGYFGSGLHGHPNKGYLVSRPYGPSAFRSVNFPRSAQTQVTSINDKAVARERVGAAHAGPRAAHAAHAKLPLFNRELAAVAALEREPLPLCLVQLLTVEIIAPLVNGRSG